MFALSSLVSPQSLAYRFNMYKGKSGHSPVSEDLISWSSDSLEDEDTRTNNSSQTDPFGKDNCFQINDNSPTASSSYTADNSARENSCKITDNFGKDNCFQINANSPRASCPPTVDNSPKENSTKIPANKIPSGNIWEDSQTNNSGNADNNCSVSFMWTAEDKSKMSVEPKKVGGSLVSQKEMVSSSSSSSSRKMSSKQEVVTQISSTGQQQQQITSSSTAQSQSSKQQSSMVSSTSIELKDKRQEMIKNQSQTSSSTSQKQIQMQGSVVQNGNQVASTQMSQKHVFSQKIQGQNLQQQPQLQHQQSQQQQPSQLQHQSQLQQQQQLTLQQQNKSQNHQYQQQVSQQSEDQTNNEEDVTEEEDLKVIGATHAPLDLAEENDLYFANMIKKEQIMNYENYSLSDDPVVSVVSNKITISHESSTNNPRNNNSLIIHPDLISEALTSNNQTSSPPPSLVLNHGSEAGSGLDLDPDDNSRVTSSRSSSKSCEDSPFSPVFGGDDLEEDEDDDEADEEDEDDLSNSDYARKKKKKSKKTESFSVIEVFDPKLRDLANKYEVNPTKKYDIGPPCELRACEKRVFEKVSVANLRRSFCDLTAQQNEDEFVYHLVERPKSFTNNLDYTIDFHAIKSSFSKFENVAGGGGNNTNNQAEDSEERANKAKNENAKSGTRICKGCNREVFVMEMIKAEKASWHKNCFRCTECKKTLSVDTYQSNAGLLYCKPHFKELFQPKAVLESPEEKLLQKIKKRPEIIIRENQPVELPPDVVRASVQPSTAELEDLSVDVKSKFELFEHYQDSEATAKDKREPVVVKKSNTVLAKLAKYEGAMDGVGIADSELNGGAPAVVSDDDEEDLTVRKPQHLDEINIKLDDVKSKWESGMNSKKEEIHKHRQEELQRFRTRLCLGKNSQLKEMYEKAVESSETEVRRNSDLEQLDFKAKRDIKEMFEKGIVRPSEDEDTEEQETTIDRDREVFENGVAKNSRNLFQNLDKQLSSGGQSPPVLPNGNGPKKIALRNPSGIIGVNDQLAGDIVRSSDIVQDEVRTEDVGNKFRFFESYQQNQDSKKEKKVFRITPPREGQVKMDSPEREVYRDPNIVRASDSEQQIQIPASRTASKMLSVFKKLEESAGSDEVDQKPQIRPLKQFTPPRETRLERKNSSEEEQSSEYESEEEDDQQYQNGGVNNEEDQFLKEVGSLARAKSLRAKFEKWEMEENNRNQQQCARMESMQQQQSQEETYQSIESAKALRAKFEQPQQFEQPKVPRREVQVKRFVELQNNNGLNMEECVMCNKRVYAMEKLEVSSKIYHKNCFRCSHCKCLLRMDTFTQNQGVLFCTPHFKQLFKIKGNYDEGFGRETGKQIWAKKQMQKAAEGGESKEN